MNKSDSNYVYYRYVDLAHYVANSVVHDYHLAQDVCQEIFIKLYLNINGLDEERVKGWILVTAENTAIDFLRKRDRLRECPGDDGGNLYKGKVPDLDEMQRSIEVKEFGHRLFCALHEKNPDWYEIVMGLDVAELPAKEVARRLGISIANLRVKHHRAREWLKNNFGIGYQELL